MRASETTFKQLVQGDKQFQVPLYQRPFSWQDDQLRRLWSDIREHANGSGPLSTHFLGSLVLAPSVVGPTGLQSWIVVDGQQRLTTLMLAMCAIRDHLSAPDLQQKARVSKTYLVNEYYEADAYTKLLPTKADRASFLACLNSTADAGGTDNIGRAYRYFRQELAGADDPSDPFDISSIERVISDQLALVAITADADDNVFRIFESINNTGLNLSQADLVRNLVFMLLPTKGDLVYETVWLPMQRRLTPDQLEDLLYLYLVLNEDERVRRDGIYQGLQRVFDRKGEDEAAVEGIVRDLARRSYHLQRVVDPQKEPDPRLRAAFERFATWGAQVAQPGLLLLLDRQERGEASSDEVVSAVGYIESFLVRRMICAVPTNNLNRIFNSLVNQLPKDKPVPEGIRFVLSRERSFWPSDQQLREAILQKPFYWQGRANQRQLVLRRLEESYPSKERVDFGKTQLTIEHVLPQTPTPDWLASLAPEVDEGESPEDLHKRLLHTLGNLTLTGYNIQLSNNAFERKQQLLTSSSLELNKRIAGTEKWGRKEIEDRANEIASRAIEIWPAPLPAVHGDTGRDWSLLHKALAAVPTGSWTTYGDLAALIGSHPVPVGVHLATSKVPNAYRALRNNGTISPGFRWLDPTDTRVPEDILRAEGVHFDSNGVADQSQRTTARELAALVGLEPDDIPEQIESGSDLVDVEERHQRFKAQLAERQGSDQAQVVTKLLERWVSFGGILGFGTAATTSCFLICKPSPNVPWPFTIYPTGSIEVVFQHMTRRPPFDSQSLRNEFRLHLNDAVGIDIPEAKLESRPSFDISVLSTVEAFDAVAKALEWFFKTVSSQPNEGPTERVHGALRGYPARS